jgi:hypothetical protein
MSLFISSVFTYDEDAGNYIQAVETADAQALEPATRKAINNFVIGCKQDGIWTAIKASCILAGARTLAGALVPLVGTAPTTLSTSLASGTDYVRKTGLVGDGSTKYLSTNRNSNQDPLNSYHLAVYTTVASSSGGHYIAAEDGGQRNAIYGGTIATALRSGGDNINTGVADSGLTGLIAATRTSSSSISYRIAGNAATAISNSVVAPDEITVVFARSLGGAISLYNNGRFAFYSIGESLNLALLDARVTDLINAFAVTIP